jgi:hypothetical protein
MTIRIVSSGKVALFCRKKAQGEAEEHRPGRICINVFFLGRG